MNGRDRTASARALRRLAAFLDDMSDEDFDGFLKGTLTIELVPRTRDGKEPATSADDNSLAAALRSTTTRQEGLDLLRSRKRSRAELAQLARQLQVHVDKNDKVELLEEKIIENVIGARLRSGAIQGINLKGSSADGANGAQTEESAPVPGSRSSKDNRNPSPRRGASTRERHELRNKLTELADQLLTSTRDSDWWRARLEADIPNLVEEIDALESLSSSDELRKSVRIMRSRLDRIETDIKKGASIGIEQTQHLAAALTDVAGSLMRAIA